MLEVGVAQQRLDHRDVRAKLAQLRREAGHSPCGVTRFWMLACSSRLGYAEGSTLDRVAARFRALLMKPSMQSRYIPHWWMIAVLSIVAFLCTKGLSALGVDDTWRLIFVFALAFAAVRFDMYIFRLQHNH